MRICTAGTISYNTNINGIASAQKFVVDDVFRNVAGIVLTIVRSGITETDICIVVFVWIFEIGLSFHIIALCHGNEERIDDVLHISWKRRVQLTFSFFILVSALAIFVGLVRELICEARKSKMSFRISSRSIPLRSTISLTYSSLLQRGQVILFVLFIC